MNLAGKRETGLIVALYTARSIVSYPGALQR